MTNDERLMTLHSSFVIFQFGNARDRKSLFHELARLACRGAETQFFCSLSRQRVLKTGRRIDWRPKDAFPRNLFHCFLR